jgi:hypothetical protein
VKCTFQGETRVIRIRKDIPYNAFMLKVSEEFGVALVVDTYEDAEGEMITLGENGVIADLGTQLSFGAKHRPYALKIFLRQAGTKRMSSVIVTPISTGERRRSSEYVNELWIPLNIHSWPLCLCADLFFATHSDTDLWTTFLLTMNHHLYIMS